MMADAATTRLDNGAFVITRRFAAPPALVWRAWTQAEHLNRWFGPKGCVMNHGVMDFRVGGQYHYGLRMADGTMVWGLWRFREILAGTRFVHVQTFSDESGAVRHNPWDANWPLLMLATTSFAAEGDGTRVTVTWAPLEASEESCRVFEAGYESMSGGWGGTFERFAEYLAQPQA